MLRPDARGAKTAVVAVLFLAALGLTRFFEVSFSETPIAFYLVAIAVAAIWLGYGYGFAVLVLSSLQLGFSLIPEIDLAHRAGRADFLRLWLYLPAALGVYWIGANARSARLRAEKARGALEEERQLLRQEKELRERFVATLTHDLRSPLTSGKLNLQLLEQHPESKELRRKAVERAIESLNRADRMIQDLLDANRISANQPIYLEFEHMDLVPLLQDLAREKELLHGDRFDLITPSHASGRWAPFALRRVFDNLVSNAVKYGKADSRIRIRLEAGRDGVIVSVHNEGNPIPPEELPRLFEPFQRAKAANRSRILGWGLGLTLVKGIVEAHRGRTYAKSAAEGGTTFVVELTWDGRKAEEAS